MQTKCNKFQSESAEQAKIVGFHWTHESEVENHSKHTQSHWQIRTVRHRLMEEEKIEKNS